MGGGTFILLKAGRPWPESAKQAEIRLAILLKMLTDRPFWDSSPRQRAKRTPDGCIYCYFPGIWLTHPELLKPAGACPAAAGSPASPPLGFIKKRARIRVHSSKGNLASIFRPIDDLEESDHIDRGRFSTARPKSLPTLALSSGMGLAERWTNSHDCLRPTRCTLSLSLCG
jgi:hypothetical protein